MFNQTCSKGLAQIFMALVVGFYTACQFDINCRASSVRDRDLSHFCEGAF